MPTVSEQMLADALAAQKFTRKYFVVELDFSLPSVQELETQFEAIRYALRGGLTAENRENLRKLWGAYLGEVLRRLANGEWIESDEDGKRIPAIQVGSTVYFPHATILDRLDSGSAANVYTWLQRAMST